MYATEAAAAGAARGAGRIQGERRRLMKEIKVHIDPQKLDAVIHARSPVTVISASR